MALAYGCSKEYLLEDKEGNVFGAPEQRYKVLSFLFDGVPSHKKGDAGSVKTASGKNIPQTVNIEHGPYAARLCEGCHQRGSNKLIMPIEALCLNCHTFRTDKRLHGPIASGGCKVCHDPHTSSNRFLLVSEATEFCFYCHDRNAVSKRDVHKGINDVVCITCHDAHMSDNEFLLK